MYVIQRCCMTVDARNQARRRKGNAGTREEGREHADAIDNVRSNCCGGDYFDLVVHSKREHIFRFSDWTTLARYKPRVYLYGINW